MEGRTLYGQNVLNQMAGSYANSIIEHSRLVMQMMLGHSNIGIIMNLYVHNIDEEKKKEVQGIEKMLKII